MALEVGVEPTTFRLTAERNYHCATLEYSVAVGEEFESSSRTINSTTA